MTVNKNTHESLALLVSPISSTNTSSEFASSLYPLCQNLLKVKNWGSPLPFYLGTKYQLIKYLNTYFVLGILQGTGHTPNVLEVHQMEWKYKRFIGLLLKSEGEGSQKYAEKTSRISVRLEFIKRSV